MIESKRPSYSSLVVFHDVCSCFHLSSHISLIGFCSPFSLFFKSVAWFGQIDCGIFYATAIISRNFPAKLGFSNSIIISYLAKSLCLFSTTWLLCGICTHKHWGRFALYFSGEARKNQTGAHAPGHNTKETHREVVSTLVSSVWNNFPNLFKN